MGDPEQSSHIIRSLGNRNVCPECADVFLAVLDAVRGQRTATDGATELAEGLAPKPCAGAPDPVRSGPPSTVPLAQLAKQRTLIRPGAGSFAAMSDLPPRVRIDLPTWLTVLIVVILILVVGGLLLEGILDNASDARQSIEDRY